MKKNDMKKYMMLESTVLQNSMRTERWCYASMMFYKVLIMALIVVLIGALISPIRADSSDVEERFITGEEVQSHYNHTITIGGNGGIDGREFVAEIANTHTLMQRGMMYRHSMPDNAAMVFVFDKPQPMTFWMKNTFIALDMLFFDEHCVLQEIKEQVPPCKTSRCDVYPTENNNNQFVVEIKAGMSKALGIKRGDRLHDCRF